MLSGWKKVLLISVGVGAGIAMGGAATIGFVAWYEGRPKPPAPWNVGALKARYYMASLAATPGSGSTLAKVLEFEYDVTNTTDFDYKLEQTDALSIMVQLKEGDGLLNGFSSDVLGLRHAAFIPAKHTVRVTLFAPPYGFEKELADDATEEERHKYHQEVEEHVTTKMQNLDGFVAFDSSNRYQINFPAGWKKAEQPAKK
jgi:hypothetical protein